MEKTIRGLNGEAVTRSRQMHGDNSLKKEKNAGFFARFWQNLSDPIIRVLLLVTGLEVLLTLGKCNWLEVGGILLSVAVATVVSTLSEMGSERAFEKLAREEEGEAVRVMRDGILQEIPLSELVVGDIVYLSQGKKVPADGTLIEGRVSCDQSALNGESREAKKVPGKRMASFDLSDVCRVFRGSVVTEGEGYFEVERVGEKTYLGGVAHGIQTDTRPSPLKLRLSRLASTVSRIGYLMAGCVAVTFLLKEWFFDKGFDFVRIGASFTDVKYVLTTLIRAITLMITVIVVAVPEGLPMMVSVVLSANMKKMLKAGVLVKKPVGIETAGSLNLLFTDKTGTLTEGKPAVSAIVGADGIYKNRVALSNGGELYRTLLLCAKYNTECVSSDSKVLGGNSTDRAIAAYFKNDREEKKQVVKRVPFSSERKYSAVTFSDGLTIVKGAPELLLEKTDRVLAENGERKPANTERLSSSARELAGNGARIVGVFCKQEGENRLTFVAFFVLKDKLRSGVKDTVETLRRAGITTVMMTGDGMETAAAIASECGIIPPRSQRGVYAARDLRSMTDEKLREILPEIRVISRALPDDKRRLVDLAQKENLVVGMTGDGINDSPSLKLADVGFAMGSGEDIAKEASDIVLLDNSLNAIANTVLFGRTIFHSIRKFITFQLIMNLAACGVSLFAQLLGIDSPITIVQMLWVNLIMDTLGGLAFAGESALLHYMREKPKKREEPILTKPMLGKICILGAFTLGLCLLFLKVPYFRAHFASYESFMTGFYALFIFAGLCNCFAARAERFRLFADIGKNKAFLVIMGLIGVVQILMVYFGGKVFRCVPLTSGELLFVLRLSMTVLIFDFFRRVFGKLAPEK